MSIFAWGENKHQELGLGESYRSHPIIAEPFLVTRLEDADIVQVSGGNEHSLVLNRNGDVFAFGRGQEGQLGLGASVRVAATPQRVKANGLGDSIVKKICAGDGCSAAITTHGELYEWGFIHAAPTDLDANNPSNALPGLAQEERRMSQRLKEYLRASTIKYLQGETAKNGEEEVEMDQAQVDAEAGILVVRTRRRMKYFPEKSSFRQKVRDIALGYAHTLIVTEVDGTAWAKGYNDRGQLGVGTRINEVNFVPVLGHLKGKPIAAIACGTSHNLAVLAGSGEMWAWGSNELGQLGTSQAHALELYPARVLIDEPVIQISAGSNHSVALTSTHTLYSFGHAEYGQHGQDTREGGDYGRTVSSQYFTPQVAGKFHPGGVKLIDVQCGQHFTCGLDDQGALWTWGFGATGSLGRGWKTADAQAQRVEGLVGHVITQVATGHKHVLAMTTPTGHSFALKNVASLLPDPDCLLVDRSSKQDEGVTCHRALILARCPRLETYMTASPIQVAGNKVFVVTLPRHTEKRVLGALVEYLYMDVVRSCPPHRLRDLQELAARDLLDLPRLANLCALQRYQRQVRLGGYISLQDVIEDSDRVTRYSQVPPSTFAKDLLEMLTVARFADVRLAAADYVDEGESAKASEGTQAQLHIPPGHTRFSWFAQPSPSGAECYSGHTPFTMGPPVLETSSAVPGTFKAHQFILMRYPFFRVLLSGHFKEEETVRAGKTLRLDTVPDAQSLENLLEWIYSGTVRDGLNGDNVADLLRSSQAFGVDDLARNCELFLLEGLDSDNAEDVLVIAKENGLSKLVRECEYVLGLGDFLENGGATGARTLK